jgi:hypothetical protein
VRYSVANRFEHSFILIINTRTFDVVISPVPFVVFVFFSVTQKLSLVSIVERPGQEFGKGCFLSRPRKAGVKESPRHVRSLSCPAGIWKPFTNRRMQIISWRA